MRLDWEDPDDTDELRDAADAVESLELDLAAAGAANGESEGDQ
jgi:hypothetical protein